MKKHLIQLTDAEVATCEEALDSASEELCHAIKEGHIDSEPQISEVTKSADDMAALSAKLGNLPLRIPRAPKIVAIVRGGVVQGVTIPKALQGCVVVEIRDYDDGEAIGSITNPEYKHVVGRDRDGDIYQRHTWR